MYILVHTEDVQQKYIQDGYVFDTVEDASKYAVEEMAGSEVEILEVVSKYKVQMKVEVTQVALKNIEKENENG
jgi:hypothetical protein